MGDSKELESVVEQAVADVLSRVVPVLREQMTQQVVADVRQQMTPGAAGGDSSVLNHALEAVQAGTTQVQILDAMIDGASSFAARAALYIVRGASAVGWRAKGFKENEAVRNYPLELGGGIAATALESHRPVEGSVEEFESGFGHRFGAPHGGVVVLPLVVREKVVALVYGDGGLEQQRIDRPALEVLVRTTGLWLEVFATRKVTAAAPVQGTSMAAAAAAGVGSSPAVPHSEPEPTPIIASNEPPPSSPEDEVQRKARRFAKLLVDEIKLYNQAKVAEGRQHRDLYDRLKEDIEKSRASFEKRYGSTVNASDYFRQELVRILADNDPSLFGGNFPH